MSDKYRMMEEYFLGLYTRREMTVFIIALELSGGKHYGQSLKRIDIKGG